MLKIGITGGIGCGKSLVADFLKEEGIKIISADKIAREIMISNTDVKAKLIAEFGSQIYTAKGELNRKELADIIFSNNEAREKINAIVHPYVIEHQAEELKRIEESGKIDIAGVEAALIYEAHAEHQFDFIIVVSAPSDIVIDRLQKRNGLRQFEIMNRIRSQIPLSEKIKRADYVIVNDGSIEILMSRVKILVNWLKEKSGQGRKLKKL